MILEGIDIAQCHDSQVAQMYPVQGGLLSPRVNNTFGLGVLQTSVHMSVQDVQCISGVPYIGLHHYHGRNLLPGET